MRLSLLLRMQTYAQHFMVPSAGRSNFRKNLLGGKKGICGGGGNSQNGKRQPVKSVATQPGPCDRPQNVDHRDREIEGDRDHVISVITESRLIPLHR